MAVMKEMTKAVLWADQLAGKVVEMSTVLVACV